MKDAISIDCKRISSGALREAGHWSSNQMVLTKKDMSRSNWCHPGDPQKPLLKFYAYQREISRKRRCKILEKLGKTGDRRGNLADKFVSGLLADIGEDFPPDCLHLAHAEA